MKNKSKIIFFLAIFLCASARIGYICCTIPDKIYVSDGENYSFDKYGFFSPLFSMSARVGKSAVLKKDGSVTSEKNYTADVRLFNLIAIKNVSVTTIDPSFVVPGGDVLGIKIYADGLRVLKITEFEGEKGETCAPCKNLLLKKGDLVKGVNGKKTKTITEFVKEIQKCSDGKAVLEVQRNDDVLYMEVFPQKDRNGTYKTGLVVKDSVAGIGTLTYYNPSDSSFGALGHAIEDGETGKIFPLGKGTLESARVVSVEKGRKGMPGQLHGMFVPGEEGVIIKNSKTGIYGTMEKEKSLENAMPVGKIAHIKEGGATILSTIDDEGVKEFSIEIERIIFANADSSKGMVIHVTDARLLNATGGIVQGMSGSPIIQNGKLIGAVTHVFVNDPTRGYGIFIENMLSEASNIDQ